MSHLIQSEILASGEWLNRELLEVQNDIRGIRRSPAWGFSRRKDFGPVQRKVERELRTQSEELNCRIGDLSAELAFMRDS